MKRYTLFTIAAVALLATHSEARSRRTRPPAPARAALEAAAAWSEDGSIKVARRAGGAWTAPEAVTDGRCSDFLPSLDLTPDDSGWAVWVRRQDGQRLLFAARFDGNRWSAAEPIATGMDINMAPTVKVDRQGIPTIIWAGFDGNDDDIFASSRQNGRWTAPARIHADNATPDILPEAALDSRGRVTVSWQHAEGMGYVPRTAVFFPGDGWSNCAAVNANRDVAHARERVWALCATAPFRRKSLDAVVLIDADTRRHAVRLTTLAALSPSLPLQTERVDRSASRWLILGFGDSITQGYPYRTSQGNGSPSGGYQMFLAFMLNRDGQAADVLNYGNGGENTFQGVSRLLAVLAAQPNADFVLIMEGTNDANGGLSYTSVLYNLDLMVQMSLQAGIEPVISTLLPSSKDETQDIPRLFNPGIKNIAANRQIRLCDPYPLFAQYFSLLLMDGVHPNWLGYLVLAYSWKLALLAL